MIRLLLRPRLQYELSLSFIKLKVVWQSLDRIERGAKTKDVKLMVLYIVAAYIHNEIKAANMQCWYFVNRDEALVRYFIPDSNE